MATDEADDEAAPWRSLLRHLPPDGAAALTALVMNAAHPGHMGHLVEALDSIARDIGA